MAGVLELRDEHIAVLRIVKMHLVVTPEVLEVEAHVSDLQAVTRALEIRNLLERRNGSSYALTKQGWDHCREDKANHRNGNGVYRAF
ncbi:MAG: hypothetical protein Q7R81_01800 [Candidatus Peregrinibacteria bacterium]|nr:hypothetical protein [Candidatus Peregrinibacteria bacterium]